MKRVKPKKKKSKKKRRKDNQRKERKATQTLAIVLGENLCNKTSGIIRNFLRSKQRQTSIHSFYSPPDPNKCKSSSSSSPISSSSLPPASFLVCWLPFFTCNILDALSIKFELNTAPGNFLFQVGRELVHNCTIFFCSVDARNIDDRCRGPSIKEKDHLVG